MKQVHRIRRANAYDRRSFIESSVMKKEIEFQGDLTRAGKSRKLTVRRCLCGSLHWNQRRRFLSEAQNEVARMCPGCFLKKYGKVRPWYLRYLNDKELLAYDNWNAAQGIKVTRVDPSTL